MISQVKGLLWLLLLSVIFLLLSSSGSHGSRCAGGWCAHGARAVPWCLGPVWAALVRAEPGQQYSFSPPGLEHVLLPQAGARGREGSRCLYAVNPTKQSGSYCCWKVVQSGWAFTFTHAFPVWSMPKCRTWKSAYGEGEMCIYSIKSRPYREISDVNSSKTVLMYLMWCDSAEATVPLDWFILAESSTQREFCLLLSCWLRMNLNKIHLLSFWSVSFLSYSQRAGLWWLRHGLSLAEKWRHLLQKANSFYTLLQDAAFP